MSIPYELIVRQDLERGYGTVTRTMPGGGSATGDKIGIHTFMGFYNVKDFGAVGDGVADDTAAIQAALDAAGATASITKKVVFDGHFRITAPLVINANTYTGLHLIGCGIRVAQANRCTIDWQGATDSTKAMVQITGAGAQSVTVENLIFMANRKAGFCFQFKGNSGSVQSVGNWRFVDVVFRQATQAAVVYGEWPTAYSGNFDCDCAATRFEHCEFVENDYGAVFDGTNCIGVGFDGCFFGFYNTSNRSIPINHIYVRTGHDIWVDHAVVNQLTNDDPNTCFLRTEEGAVSLHAIFMEEVRLLRLTAGTASISGVYCKAGAATQTRTITNVTNASPPVVTTSTVHGLTTGMTVDISGVSGATGANGTWKVTVLSTTTFSLDSASAPGAYTSGGTLTWYHYAIWAVGGVISLNTARFSHPSSQAKIRCGGTLIADGVYLGESAYTANRHGVYELDTPQTSVIEGVRPGTTPTCARNGLFSYWQATAGAGSDDTPLDWAKSLGTGGVGVLKRSTTGAVYGTYAAHMNCTTQSSDGVSGIAQDMLLPSQTKYVTVIMTGKIDDGKTPKIIVSTTGGTSSMFVRRPNGTFICWAEEDVSGGSGVINVRAGLASGETGNIYIDTLIAIPARFSLGCEFTAIWLPPPDPFPSEFFGTAAPSAGTWKRGDKVWNSAAAVGSPAGWVCVSAGSPGTWGAMANLS